MSDPRLGIGGNNPPDPIEVLLGELTAENEDMVARTATLKAVVDRNVDLKIENQEIAGKVSDQIGQILAAVKELDERRDTAKEPYRKAAQAIENFFQNRMDVLKGFVDVLRPKLVEWQQLKAERERQERQRQAELKRQQEEAARKAREEAERQAQQAREQALAAQREAERAAKKAADDAAAKAAREAAVQAAAQAEDAEREARRARQQEVTSTTAAVHAQRDLQRVDSTAASRVRGDRGSVSSLRKTFAFEVLNEDKVPRKYLMIDESAIRRAINGRDRVEKIAGIRIFEDTKGQTRT